MTNQLHFEAPTDEHEPLKEWGLHNGVVVAAALGLVALSVIVDWARNTELFAAAPLWVISFFSSLGFVLMLAAGTVLGMLVATRLLQLHVGHRGVRMLAMWGVVAVLLSAVLQAGLLMIDLQLQDAGRPLIFTVQSVSNLVTGTMAIGAAMLALAVVGRLRRR